MKNKKILGVFALVIASLMLVSSAYALNGYSVRAKGGMANYIGSNSIFTTTFAYFNGHGSMRHGTYFGSAGFHVTALTPDGDRVLLNLHLVPKQAFFGNPISVNNYAYGTYYKKGIGVKRIFLDNVNFWESGYGKLTIQGWPTTLYPYGFKVTDMDTVFIY